MKFNLVDFDNVLTEIWQLIGLPILIFFIVIFTIWPSVYVSWVIASGAVGGAFEGTQIFEIVFDSSAREKFLKDLGFDLKDVAKFLSDASIGVAILVIIFVFVVDRLVDLLGWLVRSACSFIIRGVDFDVPIKNEVIFKDVDVQRVISGVGFKVTERKFADFCDLMHAVVDAVPENLDYHTSRRALFSSAARGERLLNYCYAIILISIISLITVFFMWEVWGISGTWMPIFSGFVSYLCMRWSYQLHFEAQKRIVIQTVSAASVLLTKEQKGTAHISEFVV